jgi:hypothetical protein
MRARQRLRGGADSDRDAVAEFPSAPSRRGEAEVVQADAEGRGDLHELDAA